MTIERRTPANPAADQATASEMLRADEIAEGSASRPEGVHVDGPAYRSAEFWQWAIEACNASPTCLAQWFGSCSHTWASRKASAAADHEIAFPKLTAANNIKYPADPPDGWPVQTQEFSPAPKQIPVEERVERDRELHRLRDELKELRSKYDSSLREHSVEERLLAALDAKVVSMPPVAAPVIPRASKGSPETAVVLMSDFHIGEVVSSEETGGLAFYDFETFVSRYQYLIDSIVGIVKGKLTGYTVPTLEVFMLGDMVTGQIHDELNESAEGTVMDWLFDGAHVIAQGLRDLAGQFEQVNVTCVVGNHGRLTKQVRFKRRYVNWDYALYRVLALQLADQPNIHFDIPRSFWTLRDVLGHQFLLLHGDNIKSWMGIPFYGITRSLGRLQELLASQRRFFDYACLGHFHSAGTLDRVIGELILNGSAVGGNEFSIGALFTSNQPRQVMFGVHPEKGRTWQYALDLARARGDVRYEWDRREQPCATSTASRS